MSGPQRQITLIGFLQAQNCSNYVGSWRHPAAAPDFLSPEYYKSIARTLEAGKFHLCFFDDRLALPDILGNDAAEALRHGIRVVKLEPTAIIATMGQATRHLGLGATYSTTYYQPFHVARLYATLDHMTGGRAAWNVVTSLNSSEAHNFGRSEHLEHDARYDQADEFMEVVLGHWDSWQDDAIVADRSTGLFADPAKVRKLNHRGTYFASSGPFTVPRTPQGRPVVIQAGQSGRGRQFAARWGDLVFAIYPNHDVGRKSYAAFKQEVLRAGREPASVRVAPAVYIIPGETTGIAQAKRAFVESLAKPVDGLALLSEVLNFDFASKGMDDSFSDEELASIGGLRGILDRVVLLSGKRNPTIRDFVTFSRRGTIDEFPVFCGTPKAIADEMEAWFADACDGFVVATTHVPGGYEDVVRLVVPELQRRGLYHREYAGTTLRENLGLGRAEVDDWRT